MSDNQSISLIGIQLNKNQKSVTLTTLHKLKITKACWDRDSTYFTSNWSSPNIRLWVKITGNECKIPILLCSLNTRDVDKPLDLAFERGATITFYTDDHKLLSSNSNASYTAAAYLMGYYVIDD